MSDKSGVDIRASLEAKTTQELSEIYAENDGTAWRPEVFEIIHEILLKRGAPIPAQVPLKPKTPDLSPRSLVLETMDKKCTAELRAILLQAEDDKWSSNELDAAREILSRRGEPAPPRQTRDRSGSGSGSSQVVIVRDIRMSFGSMVIFMIKWAIASIPALLILYVIVMVLISGIGGLAFM